MIATIPAAGQGQFLLRDIDLREVKAGHTFSDCFFACLRSPQIIKKFNAWSGQDLCLPLPETELFSDHQKLFISFIKDFVWSDYGSDRQRVDYPVIRWDAASYLCFFDGSCDPNPGGHMGTGALIYGDGNLMATHTKYHGKGPHTSNNVAEYLALLWVLQEFRYHLPEPTDSGAKPNILIQGDSNLVVQQCNGHWRVKEENGGLYVGVAKMTLRSLMKVQEKAYVRIKWIPREDNTEADDLSKESVVKN